MTESQLLEGCMNQDRAAQQDVYTRYIAKVFGICKRYMKDRERAEEMAMNTFLAVFQKVAQYKNEGSFEGWVLKIAVNCCLMELRRKNNFSLEVQAETMPIADPRIHSEGLYPEDIEVMLNILPDGARIVFNLYAIEGFKHKEIAEKLGISEGTSKSQLNYAKEKLKRTFFNSLTNKTG